MHFKRNDVITAAMNGVKAYLKTGEGQLHFKDYTVVRTDEGTGFTVLHTGKHKSSYVHFLTTDLDLE